MTDGAAPLPTYAKITATVLVVKALTGTTRSFGALTKKKKNNCL